MKKKFIILLLDIDRKLRDNDVIKNTIGSLELNKDKTTKFEGKPQQVIIIDTSREPKENEYMTDGKKIYKNEVQLDGYINIYPVVAAYPDIEYTPPIKEEFLQEWIDCDQPKEIELLMDYSCKVKGSVIEKIKYDEQGCVIANII